MRTSAESFPDLTCKPRARTVSTTLVASMMLRTPFKLALLVCFFATVVQLLALAEVPCMHCLSLLAPSRLPWILDGKISAVGCGRAYSFFYRL